MLTITMGINLGMFLKESDIDSFRDHVTDLVTSILVDAGHPRDLLETRKTILIRPFGKFDISTSTVILEIEVPAEWTEEDAKPDHPRLDLLRARVSAAIPDGFGVSKSTTIKFRALDKKNITSGNSTSQAYCRSH